MHRGDRADRGGHGECIWGRIGDGSPWGMHEGRMQYAWTTHGGHEKRMKDACMEGHGLLQQLVVYLACFDANVQHDCFTVAFQYGSRSQTWLSMSVLHEIVHTMMAFSRWMYDLVISIIMSTNLRSSSASVVRMMPGCTRGERNKDQV